MSKMNKSLQLRLITSKVAPVNESRSFDFIASTPAEDGNGRIVIQDWDLARYEANPVVLWNHGMGGGYFGESSDTDVSIPIGHASNVRMQGGKLYATITLVTAEANPIAEKVYQGIKQGSLRSLSVGWRASTVRYELIDNQEVAVLSGNELFEISVVAIPANPEAVIQEQARFAASLKQLAGEKRMNIHFQLAQLAGLASSCSESELLAALTSLRSDRDGLADKSNALATQLSRFESLFGCTGEAALAAAKAAHENASKHAELSAALAARVETERKESISRMIDEAERAGKVTPAGREECEKFIAECLGGKVEAAKRYLDSLHAHVNMDRSSARGGSARTVMNKSYNELSSAEKHALYNEDRELFEEMRANPEKKF